MFSNPVVNHSILKGAQSRNLSQPRGTKALLGLQQPLQATGIIQDGTAASIQEEISIADSTQDVSKSQHQGGCAARILSGSDVRSNVVDNEHKSYCHHKVTGQSCDNADGSEFLKANEEPESDGEDCRFANVQRQNHLQIDQNNSQKKQEQDAELFLTQKYHLQGLIPNLSTGLTRGHPEHGHYKVFPYLQ